MFIFSKLFNNLSEVHKNKVKILTGTGLFMSCVGSLLFLTFPILVNMGLKSQMKIKLGNDITNSWLDVPLPITVKVHIWTIENPKELISGAKPVIREIGPYYWNQHRWKEIISWGDKDVSVEYWTLQSFTFDKSRTTGKLSDKITVINVPVYAMAYVVKSLVDKLPMALIISPIVFGFVKILFVTHGEGLLKELTVGQLIEGYPFTILNTIDILTKPLTWFGIKLPDNGMPGNRFGLLSVKNFTKGGPYEVFTGQGTNPDNFLKFISYQGKKFLDFYDDPFCNLMNGTDGTTMGSFLSKSDTVYIFQGDACKSMHITYKEDSSVKGISTYRFIFPKTLFASPDKNPNNKCFCRTQQNYEMCDGIFDLGPCQKGAPLAFSFPHLMHSSKRIQNSVIGINPNIEKHESFFDIQPTLGAALRAAGRLQVNVLLKPIPLLPGFGNVREAVVPYVWIEEFVEIEGIFETQIKAVTIALSVITYGSLLLLVLGLIVASIGIVYGLTKRNNSSRLISEADSESIPSLSTQLKNKITEEIPNGFVTNNIKTPVNQKVDEMGEIKTNDEIKVEEKKISSEDNQSNYAPKENMAPIEDKSSPKILNQVITQTPTLSSANDSNIFIVTQQRSNVGFDINGTKFKITNENSFQNVIQKRSSPPGNVE